MATKSVQTVLEASDGQRLSDVAYARILEILFERKVAAGAYVSQGDLVELTGVSVGPLRDALRILEAEGVLTIHPRAGIEFVKPGLELTRATYQFRGIIEAAAVAVYAEIADAAEIEELQRRHIQAIQKIEESGLTFASLAELEILEQLLHNAIIASLRNPLIETSYRRIHNYLRLIRLDRKLTPPLALRSLREHLEIIEACQARDPNKAETALQAHFNAALRRHMGLY
ncbi:MAG: GntR family transcriptional regulator [Aestuariivirga sp.]